MRCRSGTSQALRCGLLALALLPGVAGADIADDAEVEFGDLRVSLNRGIRYRPHKNFELRVGGRLHLDFYDFDDDVKKLGSNSFDIRRARVFGKLEFFQDWGIMVDGELSNYHIDRRGWRNLWLEYTGIRRLLLRGGSQTAPMGMEDLQGSNNTTFMERSLAATFAPSFRTGAMARYSGKRNWSAAGGVFFDPIGGVKDDPRRAEGKGFVGRAAWAPFYDHEDRQLIHVAASAEYRDIEKELRYSSRPESGGASRLVDTGTIRNVDDLVTVGAELGGVWGPVSVRGEYLRSFVFRSGSELSFHGGFADVSWIVTGESVRYNPKSGVFGEVRPKRDFGAVELAARYSAIDLIDENVRGGRERDWTVGVNWYLTRNLRLMFNHVWVRARDRGIEDQPRILQFRIQFAI
jgi:phosphate-selective porin OprO/OprP